MEDFCIVCSRTIVSPDDLAAPEQIGAAGTAISGSSSKADAQSQHGSDDGAAGSSGMQRTGSGNRAGGAVKNHHHHPHRARHAVSGYHHAVKIRKNQSSSKLAAHGHKAALKALAQSCNVATAPPVSEAQPTQAEDAVTEDNLPNWMSIYCSEECRKEDELRARLSFANLNEQRIRLSPSPPVSGAVRTVANRFSCGLPSSPLSQGSDGSDFDWSARRDSGADVGSRRFSDGSESSRFTGSRKSSRTRGSTDSLASYGDLDHGSYQHRPDVHRSTSALSSGLRAMTPIHLVQSSSSSSPRDKSSPQRGPTLARASKPSQDSWHAPVPSSSLMARSSSDASSGSVGPASSTFIPSSVKTFKPASVGRSGLKPSRSSATLALTHSSDVRATLSSDWDNHFDAPSRPACDHQRKSAHRTSNGSIPYLSCSPSSPETGSVASARSAYSTDPSTSSARGELEDPYGTARKPSPYSDERDKPASLLEYGLFFRRTPSTPALSAMRSQTDCVGRSPPAQRNSRLSASYDTKSHASGTISAVFLARQQRNKSSSNLQASASRRTSYDESAGRRELHRSETSESTPTQSVYASRASSFTTQQLSTSVPGRTDPNPLNRPDFGRTPSTGSIGSYGSMKHAPSQLRQSVTRESASYAPDIQQIAQEEYTLQTNHSRALNASQRSKSRSSFSWDHLPSYIPQYPVMDLEKIRRNRSGASLHSVSEDVDGEGEGSRAHTAAPPAHRKRLFYFPEECWLVRQITRCPALAELVFCAETSQRSIWISLSCGHTQTH